MTGRPRWVSTVPIAPSRGREPTPGPWLPVQLKVPGLSGSFWVVLSREGRLPESEGNARLQAEAHAMRDALRGLMQWIDNKAIVRADPALEYDEIQEARRVLARLPDAAGR